jgi:hypothetical protein
LHLLGEKFSFAGAASLATPLVHTSTPPKAAYNIAL